jgi:hypothetical protein
MDTPTRQKFWPTRFLAVLCAIREASVMKTGASLSIAMGFGLFALASACSSSPGPAYPGVDSFCQAKAEAECQVAAKCAVTMQSCMTARLSACSTTAIEATQALGRGYVADNAQACVEAAKAAYATGWLPPSETDASLRGSMAYVCSRVFLGGAGKNAACGDDNDCASGRICAAVAPSSSAKVCADQSVRGESDFCADPGAVCGDGLYCSTAQGAAQCKRMKAEGEACGQALPCAAGLRCDVSNACQKRLGPGAPCTSDADCSDAAPYCDKGAGSVCDAGLSFAPPPSTSCVGFGR